MAAHLVAFPPTSAEPFVRGDPATWAVRFRKAGVDQDITTWTWRSYVRDKIDGSMINKCETFDVATPAELDDMYDWDTSTVPCVLLLQWTEEQTALWVDKFVADIEQLTPTKRTWLIIDGLRIDRDVSNEPGDP